MPRHDHPEVTVTTVRQSPLMVVVDTDRFPPTFASMSQKPGFPGGWYDGAFTVMLHGTESIDLYGMQLCSTTGLTQGGLESHLVRE
jgi:hypothetical protein